MKVRASVNGITIGSLKEFKGHEGEPLFQGNVYYRGKKKSMANLPLKNGQKKT